MTRFVETDALLAELDQMLDLATSGRLFETTRFVATPTRLRRVNDIAFSGDGEPTTYRNFDELIAACAEVKRRHGQDTVKMVLISNASMFHRPHVQRGLAILDANNGEIWAKLDAGTEAYYQLIERTTIPFDEVLANIIAAARVRPIVIQSLFMQVDGVGPSDNELTAYCERLSEITAAGGRLSLVQVYTIARPPAESNVAALPDAEVDRIVTLVRNETGLVAEPFYGVRADD
jgi:wyosine [tRNA(Phe)-imidazoG37] synthetase (radical SAM superfamily)